ncbi:sensor histidine kinase [Alkalihalobacillus sp. NPDC078783]
MTFLVEFLGALIETVPLLLITLHLLNRLHISRLPFLFLLSIVTSIFLTLSASTPLIKLPLAVLLLAILISKLYKSRFSFSLLSLLFSMMLLLIIELLTLNFLSPFYSEYTTGFEFRFFTGLINSLCLFLIFLPLYLFDYSFVPKNEISKLHHPKFWWVLPISIVLFMLTVSSVVQSGLTILVTYMVLIVCISFIFFMRNMIYKVNVESEKLMQREQEKNANNYLKSIRAQRHDFIYQLNTINSLVYLNKIDDLKVYLSNLTDEFKTTSETLPLHFASVSGLLIQYKQIFKKDGVNLNIVIEDDFSKVPMPIHQFNSIIGNLLQNSYEHVILHENCSKEITIKFMRDKSLILEVINEVNISTLKLDKLFIDGYSTKKVHKSGIGLNNVMTSLSNYKGMLYPELKHQTLSMFIILPISSNEGND